MKATEQYFHVVLFIMLSKVVLAFKSVDETLVCDHIQMKATEQSFHVVLFIMLYKVVLILMSADETYCGIVYYAIRCAANVLVCG